MNLLHSFERLLLSFLPYSRNLLHPDMQLQVTLLSRASNRLIPRRVDVDHHRREACSSQLCDDLGLQAIPLGTTERVRTVAPETLVRDSVGWFKIYVVDIDGWIRGVENGRWQPFKSLDILDRPDFRVIVAGHDGCIVAGTSKGKGVYVNSSRECIKYLSRGQRRLSCS